MQIVRFNSPHDFRKIERDLSKFWESDWRLVPSLAETTALDMYEEDRKLIVEVKLPGFKKNEISVSTSEGALEVTAEHQEKEEEKVKRRYYVRESSNRYWRRAVLPEGVNADKAEASFKDGILKISMPSRNKKKATKPITVE